MWMYLYYILLYIMWVLYYQYLYIDMGNQPRNTTHIHIYIYICACIFGIKSKQPPRTNTRVLIALSSTVCSSGLYPEIPEWRERGFVSALILSRGGTTVFLGSRNQPRTVYHSDQDYVSICMCRGLHTETNSLLGGGKNLNNRRQAHTYGTRTIVAENVERKNATRIYVRHVWRRRTTRKHTCK